MYILICWSVAGRPGTSVLFLGEIPMLPAHTLRPEERVKPAPPVWPTYGWATPALRPTKPAIPRVAGRPTLLSRGKVLERQGREAARIQAGRNGVALLAVALPACAGLALTADYIAASLVGPAFRPGVAALIPIMSLAALARGVRAHFIDHASHLSGR